MYWTTIELGFAIICACLPTYGPLLEPMATSLERCKSWFTSLPNKMLPSRNKSTRNENNVTPNNEFSRNGAHDGLTDQLHLVSAVGGQIAQGKISKEMSRSTDSIAKRGTDQPV